MSPESSSDRWRVSITTVAVFGFGGLVALSVGLVLWVGLHVATDNTARLLQSKSEDLITALEARLHARLRPVEHQARWIAGEFSRGRVGLSHLPTLDTFMWGALAATPQVAGIGVIGPRGYVRRWGRSPGPAVFENWSARPEIKRWLETGRVQHGPVWTEPFWTHTLDTTVMLLGTPLSRDGRFLGMLAQVVPITRVSTDMANIEGRTRITPFVLYERTGVLAHPLLAALGLGSSSRSQPLVHIDDLGDPWLPLMWKPDEVPFLLRGIQGLTAAGLQVGDRYRVFLHRDIEGYGPGRVTLGLHFDADDVVGDIPEQIGTGLAVGAALLALSIAAAVLSGRRLSHPIRRLARAAAAVQAGRYDAIPDLPQTRVRELDAAMQSFQQMAAGLAERQRIRDVLGRFVPERVARTLLAGDGGLPPEEADASILFCDLEGFTSLTERVGPGGIFDVLNEYFEAMVAILERHGGIVTQFQGDAILATFNVPLADPEHTANALRAAREMVRLTAERRFAGEALTCRIGINTGPVVAGAVGAKGRLSYTVHGDAVNLAARLESLNKEHGTRILVSANTAAKVSDFELRAVGEVTVRGQSRPVGLLSLDE